MTPTRGDTPGVRRFELRALLGWGALLAGAVPFLLLWLLVQGSWSPLAALDGDVAAGLNRAVSGSPLLVGVLSAVTDLGGTGVAVLTGGVLVAASARAQDAKIAQELVQYQDKPKDGQRCDGCSQWAPPNACVIVAGNIAPEGWCVAWAPKEG